VRADRYVLAFVLLAPSMAFAQTLSDGVESRQTTSEGVAAFNRGDYARAAQILKPIAERWVGPDDQIALFHMATMYQEGLGVGADPMRACVLFARATLPSSPTTGAYLDDASKQLQRVQDAMNDEQRRECFLIAHLGFEHGFQPATFALGLGEWIGFDLAPDTQGIIATISREGKATRREVPVMMLGGTRFLPYEHTELMTGANRGTPRHFIEFFNWFPSLGGEWSLSWQLLEVVRDDLVSVAAAILVTNSTEPRLAPTSEWRQLVRIGVNNRGDAEWEVLGSHPQRDVIETDAERREVSELSRLRRDADARVDWTGTRNVHDAPILTYSDADGCGNFFVYGWSEDRTEAITVHADRVLTALSTSPQTFDLRVQPGLDVEVHVAESPEDWPFCTDLIVPNEKRRETWRAVSGTVTIELSPPRIRVHLPLAYRAGIWITGAEFISTTGVRIKQVKPIKLTAIVRRLY
jgi:hypothetical protein